jgi:hypothetical protein
VLNVRFLSFFCLILCFCVLLRIVLVHGSRETAPEIGVADSAHCEVLFTSFLGGVGELLDRVDVRVG